MITPTFVARGRSPVSAIDKAEGGRTESNSRLHSQADLKSPSSSRDSRLSRSNDFRAVSKMGPDNVVKNVGRRIRLLRVSRPGPRMTQEDLSRRARISVSFLSMIERGERSPHLETLARVAGGLGVTLETLFSADAQAGVEPILRPLLDACRKYKLGKREVALLVSIVRAMS